MRKSIHEVVANINQWIRDNYLREKVTFITDNGDHYLISVNSNEQVVYDFVKEFLHYEQYEVILKKIDGNNTIIAVAK